MQKVIQVVNFIKAIALNSHSFAKMCSNFWFKHIHLLYYLEIRWLSRGKALQRLLELRTEKEVFLAKKIISFAQKLADLKWLMQVAYLADMFAEIDSLNISMQGRDQRLVGFSENEKDSKKN